jgi:glycosyltransferase involved in cell wall biosynthesis
MISPRFIPLKGGVEKHVEMVAKKLVEYNIDVTIVTLSHKTGLEEHTLWMGFRIIRMPTRCKNPFHAYRWWIANRNVIAKHDIVHIHDAHQFLFWYLPLVFMFPLKRCFITFHGFERDPIPTQWIVFRKITEILTKKSICIGDFIETFYGTSCDRLSIGAVDISAVSAPLDKGLIFVGRLERDTGILKHVDALHILKSKYGIDLELVVCGSGSLIDEIRAVSIERNLKIELKGNVEDPFKFIKNASICFAAGYLSILEAMSMGLPVIGVATSPLKLHYLKAVKNRGGPISIQTTSEGIAREVARIMTQTALRQNLFHQSKDFARKQSWERLTKVYLELWEDSPNAAPL